MTRRRFTVSRRAALGLLGAGAPLLVEAPARAQTPPRLDRVSFVTNWRAQAEHGGFYQAQAAGLYRNAGLEVELRSGGPQVNPAQLLLGGRVDMSMGNGVTALNFVQQDIPFLCIGAVFQKDMVVLHRASRHRLHRVRGAARADHPDQRRAAGDVVAVPPREVRAQGRAGAALHLLHGALPRRPDAGAAGLSRLRALQLARGRVWSRFRCCCTMRASRTTAPPSTSAREPWRRGARWWGGSSTRPWRAGTST